MLILASDVNNADSTRPFWQRAKSLYEYGESDDRVKNLNAKSRFLALSFKNGVIGQNTLNRFSSGALR